MACKEKNKVIKKVRKMRRETMSLTRKIRR